MSLREIVKRFVRREPLPVSHEGQYEDRFGDLEKLKNADITEQFDRVEELKQQIAAFEKREKQRAEKRNAQTPSPIIPATPTNPTPGTGEPVNQNPHEVA